MAICTAAKSLGTGNACAAMESDIVKPMPANAPAPLSCRYEWAPDEGERRLSSATEDTS
jgi:hypothetical protein